MQPAFWDMAQPADTAWTAGAARALFIRRDTLDALLPRPLDLHGVLPRGAAAASLFEPLGGVARYIRGRRLARCHATLSRPGPRQYIERVAYDHGFGSASQFSRAFFEQFGYSPREARMHPAPQREQSSGREMVNENFRIVLEEIGRA